MDKGKIILKLKEENFQLRKIIEKNNKEIHRLEHLPDQEIADWNFYSHPINSFAVESALNNPLVSFYFKEGAFINYAMQEII